MGYGNFGMVFDVTKTGKVTVIYEHSRDENMLSLGLSVFSIPTLVTVLIFVIKCGSEKR